MINPFKSACPYTYEDAKLFKGRDSEILEVSHLLLQEEAIVLYAESGEGKSSFIDAGVMPNVGRNRLYPIKIRFVEDDFKNKNIDFDSYIYNLLESEKLDFVSKVKDCEENVLRGLNESAWWKLRENFIMKGLSECIPVLIFDQFEEVLSKPNSYDWTNKFFFWLNELLTDVCPPKVQDILIKYNLEWSIETTKQFKSLFSIRTDAIGELDFWIQQKYYMPWLKKVRYCLKPLSMKGAEEVAALGKEKFNEETIQNLIKLACYDKKTDDIPLVSAMMLSVVCHERYDDENAYIPTNNLISFFYKTQIQNSSLSEKEQESFENKVVDGNGKRIRMPITELQNVNLAKLKENHIIYTIEIHSSKYVELVHDKFCDIIIENRKNRNKIREKKIEIQRNNILIGLWAIVYSIAFYWGINECWGKLWTKYAQDVEGSNGLEKVLLGFLAFLNNDPYNGLCFLSQLIIICLPYSIIYSIKSIWRIPTIYLYYMAFLVSTVGLYHSPCIFHNWDNVFIILCCCFLISLLAIICYYSKWKFTKSIINFSIWNDSLLFRCLILYIVLISTHYAYLKGASNLLPTFVIMFILPLCVNISFYKGKIGCIYSIMILLSQISEMMGVISRANDVGIYFFVCIVAIYITRIIKNNVLSLKTKFTWCIVGIGMMGGTFIYYELHFNPLCINPFNVELKALHRPLWSFVAIKKEINGAERYDIVDAWNGESLINSTTAEINYSEKVPNLITYISTNVDSLDFRKKGLSNTFDSFINFESLEFILPYSYVELHAYQLANGNEYEKLVSKGFFSLLSSFEKYLCTGNKKELLGSKRTIMEIYKENHKEIKFAYDNFKNNPLDVVAETHFYNEVTENICLSALIDFYGSVDTSLGLIVSSKKENAKQILDLMSIYYACFLKKISSTMGNVNFNFSFNHYDGTIINDSINLNEYVEVNPQKEPLKKRDLTFKMFLKTILPILGYYEISKTGTNITNSINENKKKINTLIKDAGCDSLYAKRYYNFLDSKFKTPVK